MEKIEETIKELKELYTKAVTPRDYWQVWEKSLALRAELPSDIPLAILAKIMLNGFWARYYRIKKSLPELQYDREILYDEVALYFHALTTGDDLEITINYGYLLSIILSQLKEAPKSAERINDEISRLVKSDGNVVLGLKVINAQGLNAMQKKDWQGAIVILTTAKQKFQEALNIPEALQHFANILNNRGLSRLNLSDGVEGWKEKKGLISSAIVDLRDAEQLYMKVTPPPLKHIDGLENRLIMAAMRILSLEGGELAKAGERIKAAFETKNREGAKKIIFSLRELTMDDVKMIAKIEGKLESEVVISGDTMVFVGAIQVGLRMADEFLEIYKEEAK